MHEWRVNLLAYAVKPKNVVETVEKETAVAQASKLHEYLQAKLDHF